MPHVKGIGLSRDLNYIFKLRYHHKVYILIHFCAATTLLRLFCSWFINKIEAKKKKRRLTLILSGYFILTYCMVLLQGEGKEKSALNID